MLEAKKILQPGIQFQNVSPIEHRDLRRLWFVRGLKSEPTQRSDQMKHFLRKITPCNPWQTFLRICFPKKMRFKYGVEQSSDFYDYTYAGSKHWKKHYTQSHYYPIWTVIGDRVRRKRPKRVLDIGCGPGQVACMLRDIGVPEYIGLDFSKARIARARDICPEYEFLTENVFESQIFEIDNYDLILATEFLEHIEHDINVLEKARKGTTVIGTVPNFPATGHVRHFKNTEEVLLRYRSILSELNVTPIFSKAKRKIYFVLQGTR